MNLSGWGRYPQIRSVGHFFETSSKLCNILNEPKDYIVYGKGRSYGDSALNENVIYSCRFDKILDFDPHKGLLSCESGVTLEDLIKVFLPKGWFLPVTPGTKFITLGGAVASDVHGKNHHNAGCFSNYITSFDLLLPDGNIVGCTHHNNKKLFRATCGGMGLTGIILTVTIKMRPVQSAFVREVVIPCRNLAEIFSLFENHQSKTYSVAWVDCQAKGDDIGRSILMLGEHAKPGPLRLAKDAFYSIPFNLPGFCLNKHSLELFNHFYYRLNSASTAVRQVHLDGFFYPLDRINHWNRIYGKNGFVQYQFVLPKEASFDGIRTILTKVSESGLISFLGTLKLFGNQNKNYLSFPLEGYTLALDFKMHKRLFPFLNELDRVVLDYGGRLYLAKDARMSREVYTHGYPKWEKFAELREKQGLKLKFRSLQSRRLGL